MLHIIYCYRSSLLSTLLLYLSSHPLPSLHYLHVKCDDDSEVRALTTFLPQCTDLHMIYYERYRPVLEWVEEKMWEAAVRRCRNLGEVMVRGDNSCVSYTRLESVLRKLSETEGIQALKLRRIVRLNKYTEQVIEDFTEQVKHLLPDLQQQSQQQ